MTSPAPADGGSAPSGKRPHRDPMAKRSSGKPWTMAAAMEPLPPFAPPPDKPLPAAAKMPVPTAKRSNRRVVGPARAALILVLFVVVAVAVLAVLIRGH